MKKSMLSLSALALLAFATPADAFTLCPQGPGYGAMAAPAAGAVISQTGIDIAAVGAGGADAMASGAIVAYPLILGAIVVCDILDGGLKRAFAEVTPGQGYHPGNLASRDDESTKLFAAFRKIEESEALLASAK